MKKLITLLMLTAMLLGVAGCGGSTLFRKRRAAVRIPVPAG